MGRLLFVDTETTGLDPERHEVWELAYITREEDGTESETCVQLPVNISAADPTSLRLVRFYDRYAPSGDAATHAREFAHASAGAHIVGMVPSFDAVFLDHWLRSYRYRAAWHYHLVDAEALVAGHLGVGPPWDSEELSRKVGIEPPGPDERHTALGDARWTKRLFDAVLREGARQTPIYIPETRQGAVFENCSFVRPENKP